MTSDPSAARRVTRLENDVESLYELVAEVRATQDEHARSLAELRATQHDHGLRLAGVESTLADHTGRFDRVDETLAEVLRRLPEPS